MADIPKGLEIRVFELMNRLRWLSNLRWIAVAMMAAVIEIAANVYGLRVFRFQLYLAVAAVAIGNAVLIAMVGRVNAEVGKATIEKRARLANVIANAQISFDLFMLTVLIHYAGGIENSFAFYYIFHVVIASILLEPLHCSVQAALACALYTGLISLEHAGALSHYSLYEGISQIARSNAENTRLIGVIVAFVSTIAFMAYMATSISMRLRAKENLLLETNMKLVELDAKKSEFVMIVAHELKSPLGTIQFMLKSLTGGFAGATVDEKTKEVIAKVEGRAENLLKFVNELLDLSKIKTGFGAKEFKRISFVEKLKKSLALLDGVAKANEITISVDVGSEEEMFMIVGDPEYLENAIINIVSNAIKYNKKGGFVKIALAREGDMVIFTCEDTGIGIPKDDLDKIFNEFHRTSISKKHTANGTGIGMSITKRIVEYHNGNIKAESEPGQGTKFTVSLPVNTNRN